MLKILNNKLSPSIIFLSLSIVFLNIFDAFATLRHIYHGAVEVNPFMNYCINKSVYFFFGIKYFLLALALFIVNLYPNKNVVKNILITITTLYSLLAIYQIALFYI